MKGFLAQKYKDENNCEHAIQLEQDIEAGKTAADKACQYVDWLLSTVNPIPPEDEVWIRPSVHLCQKRRKDIPDHQLESDYAGLLNMVQQHTRCSTSYCLRKKAMDQNCNADFIFHLITAPIPS